MRTNNIGWLITAAGISVVACTTALAGSNQMRGRLFLALASMIVVLTINLAACTGNSSEELVQAAKSGNIETVTMLLEAGADVNAKDSEHQSSALMWAAHEGHTDIMNLLIEHGANIDEQRSTGETAFWFTAQKGQLEAMKILVSHGADINVVGREGKTALDIASQNGYQEIVGYLREAGAGD